jgi:hypothetical protein
MTSDSCQIKCDPCIIMLFRIHRLNPPTHTHAHARTNIPMCMCLHTIAPCSFTHHHKHYPHSATESVVQQLIAYICPHILLFCLLTRCIRPAPSASVGLHHLYCWVLQYSEPNRMRSVLGSTSEASHISVHYLQPGHERDMRHS